MTGYDKVIQTWQGWNVRTASALSNCLNASYVQSIHESNNIDGTPSSDHVAREVVVFGTVTRYTGSLLVLTELSNATMCHNLLCKRFEERAPFTVELVREIHSTLMAGCYDKRRYIDLEERPGEFKKHDFIVGKDEVGVEPSEVEEELECLLEELRDFMMDAPSAERALYAGAYFHAKFECIHPFADGNGRVGRLLLNYWLLRNNHPPITIYSEDKQRYFDCLQAYVDSEDLTPLHTFLVEQTIKTWTTYSV